MRNLYKFLREIALLGRGMGVPFTLNYLYTTCSRLPLVLKTRSLGVVDLCIKEPLSVHVQGERLLLAADALPLVRELLLRNCYGFDMAREYDVILDLGSNRGVFTAMAARVAKRVIAVECDTADMPGKFRQTLQDNAITNATLISRFVSDSDTRETISINSIAREHGIAEIGFLKMDVEGAEKGIFAHNTEWLDLTRALSLEVHPCFGVDEQKILGVLSSRGFRTTLRDKDLRVVPRLPADSMGYIWAFR